MICFLLLCPVGKSCHLTVSFVALQLRFGCELYRHVLGEHAVLDIIRQRMQDKVILETHIPKPISAEVRRAAQLAFFNRLRSENLPTTFCGVCGKRKPPKEIQNLDISDSIVDLLEASTELSSQNTVSRTQL